MKHLKLFEDFNEETALNPAEITDFSMESGESDDICPNCKCHCTNCECKPSEEGEENFEDDFEGNFDENEFGNDFEEESDEEDRHVSSFNQFESNEKKSNKLTKKEKELAAKYPPKDKITRGDIITAAKENAAKKDKKDDKKEEKGSGKLTAAQRKLPEALRKAIEKRK
jgi:hypothetical protein